ncbi:TIGR00366 family protein [Sporosarcina sp. GW1-11]|uniref:YfcC family protein n=1 Tax=Sporosarcina sp. GW1-11 TaxID=2899126 RepID=UPI00294F44D3|nr:TIGR00366 family protein [Sporosarcina sp. GW1-11]MDV6378585.1 TIGR00366 family protein [Sporosarcina sp. GW1-11]
MNIETIAEKKKKTKAKTLSSYLKIPHVFALIFFIILITAAMTYIVPAGEFDRVEDPESGRMLVEDGSFHTITNNPVSPIAIPGLIIAGLNASSGIILFIFVVGGSFRIITSTGAFDAVIRSVASKLGKREVLIIPLLMFIFAIGGATIGMSIEALGLVPLVVALARSLKYDALTGMAIVLIGAFCGFIAGVMNPFTVGVAQEIAGLPIYSGMWLRMVLLVVLVIVSSIYIIRYAKKVKADPSKSLVADLEEEARASQQDLQLSSTFQVKDFLVILTFALGIGLLIWGVKEKGWYIEEMAALFLAMGIISGICARFSSSRISEEFIEGAKAVILGALIVGIARTIPLVLEEGKIIDSLVYGLSNIIMFMPDSIKVISIYLSQNVINFFINSGSGQAAVTMPIMVPLGDLVGITRQTTVLSFHLGDGFTNLIFPTGSTLMAYLAATGISYEKWVKFIWPLMIIFISIGAIFVVFASVINY